MLLGAYETTRLFTYPDHFFKIKLLIHLPFCIYASRSYINTSQNSEKNTPASPAFSTPQTAHQMARQTTRQMTPRRILRRLDAGSPDGGYRFLHPTDDSSGSCAYRMMVAGWWPLPEGGSGRSEF